MEILKGVLLLLFVTGAVVFLLWAFFITEKVRKSEVAAHQKQLEMYQRIIDELDNNGAEV